MLGRTWFLVAMFLGGLAAVAWAIYGAHLPPADFTFVNETEVASVDPALITGQPEGRIVSSLFEGLTRLRPDNTKAEPGVAEKWDISDDGRTYTFHLRDNARWSNGDPVTAQDFLYSIPAADRSDDRLDLFVPGVVHRKREAVQLERQSSLEPGDPVEVELNPPANAVNTVRGKLLLGKLRADRAGGTAKARGGIGTQTTYVVEIDGTRTPIPAGRRKFEGAPSTEHCRQVLLDFREVGIKVIDDRTLQIRLTNPTPYFLESDGLLSTLPRKSVVRREIRQAGLDEAGKHCLEWGLLPRRPAAARSRPAKTQRTVLGS